MTARPASDIDLRMAAHYHAAEIRGRIIHVIDARISHLGPVVQHPRRLKSTLAARSRVQPPEHPPKPAHEPSPSSSARTEGRLYAARKAAADIRCHASEEAAHGPSAGRSGSLRASASRAITSPTVSPDSSS